MKGSSPSPLPTNTYDPTSPTQEAVPIEKEALPKQTKDREEQEIQATSLIGSNWIRLYLSPHNHNRKAQSNQDKEQDQQIQ